MNQKEEERLIIDHFRNNYPDFPSGKLFPSESPDFILRQNPKTRIGFELTQLIQQSKDLFQNIQNTLDKKEIKLMLYKKHKLKSIWLIIYTDYLETGKSFNISNKIQNREFKSGFDRIILFDLFENKYFVINLYKTPG